jgi:toxin YoeB
MPNISYESWDDYLYWQKTDKSKLKKINELIKDIKRNPFKGLGKPESLRFQLKGCWLRKIDYEHRFSHEEIKKDLGL